MWMFWAAAFASSTPVPAAALYTSSADAAVALCERHGFAYAGRKQLRRLFVGSLIADDTWDPIRSHAAEAESMYHTMAFIEPNRTQAGFSRALRFTPGSEALGHLQRAFGDATAVSVDPFLSDLSKSERSPLEFEGKTRRAIRERWVANGMRGDDVGIVSDTDEFFSNGFLRAMRLCDVPQFRPGQDCREPKLVATTLIYEGSPKCVWTSKLWFHPDAIIGECIDGVGDRTLHPPGQRLPQTGDPDDAVKLAPGYGRDGPYDYSKMPDATRFPLWQPQDFRFRAGARRARRRAAHHYNAFHLHNFFHATHAIRRKYATYGHPDRRAYTKPLEALHEDVGMLVNCTRASAQTDPNLRHRGDTDWPGDWPKPVYFTPAYEKARHLQLQRMIRSLAPANATGHVDGSVPAQL